MSIEGKHSYRFGYLKSDKWQAVRLEALVREKGKCQICGEESISNDAHHIWYPENIYDTTEQHLVILCRACHEFIHEMLPECKTDDAEKGTAQWLKFRNAILAWRQGKMELFDEDSVNVPLIVGNVIKLPELRDAYVELRKHARLTNEAFQAYLKKTGGPTLSEVLGHPVPKNAKSQAKPKPIKAQLSEIVHVIKRWAEGYAEYVTCEEKPLVDSDFQI